MLKSYIVLITLIATLGGLLFGYDTAVISGAVGSIKVYFVDPRHIVDENAANSFLGNVVSSALIGCIIGGLLGGVVASTLGRKLGLLIAAVLFMVPEMFFAPIGQGGSGYIWNFVFYRILGGIGVGLASMLSPMYIAEVAPAKMRGNLVAWNQLAIIFGMLVVYFVNYAISRSGSGDAWLNQVGWRYMFASGAIPSGIFLSLLFLVPETPRFLMMKGREAEARAVLARTLTEDEAHLEIKEIHESLAHHASASVFSYGMAIIVFGIMLSVFQQFVGINVVLYYAPEIFKSMGTTTDVSLLETIIVGAVNLAFTVVAVLCVDRYGRRPLQIIGALVMAGAMFGLGFSLMMQSKGMFSLICMLVYIAGFAVSWGPVTWVLLSEMFPNKIRNSALAIAVTAQWIANYLVSWSFPIMKDNPALVAAFHYGFPYFVYGVMGVLAALFTWKFIPETKGRTLEELEQLWEKKT
jgi:SP family xylose:H+ symportor-like MFS transporter